MCATTRTSTGCSDLLRYHWLEEAQHAKLDTLLIGEVAEDLTLEERETAIDEVLELGGAIDGLLAQQIGMNIEALEKATGRTFTDGEEGGITANTQRAWRWTFLVSDCSTRTSSGQSVS